MTAVWRTWSPHLSTVGFLGRIVKVVGAGEVRSGVGALASPMGAGGKRQGNRTQGDPRVPTLLPCHPRPYGTNPLPCSFHKIPTLERVTPGEAARVTTSGTLCPTRETLRCAQGDIK